MLPRKRYQSQQKTVTSLRVYQHFKKKEHCHCGEKLDNILHKGGAIRPHNVNFRELVTCFKYGERVTHSIHPYPAKLLPHIPHCLISHPELCAPNGTVGDPFCGSGTVALESALMGYSTWGCDLNPLARLIAQVKTTPIDPARIARTHRRVEARVREITKPRRPDVLNLEYWYYPHIINGLAAIAETVNVMRSPDLKEFFQVALSVTAKRLCLADPRIPVPVLTSPDKYPKDHWLHRYHAKRLGYLQAANPLTEFSAVVRGNSDRNRRLWDVRDEIGKVKILNTDARDLLLSSGRRMIMGSADLIVTSPPYGSAQKYTRSSSLSLGWLSLWKSDSLTALDKFTIGREQYRKGEVLELPVTGITHADSQLKKRFTAHPYRSVALANYLLEMRKAMIRSYEIIAKGGHLVLVVGDNIFQGARFRTSEYLQNICEDAGFKTRAVLIDQIKSRGLLTRRNSTAGIITDEKVVIFRKDQ